MFPPVMMQEIPKKWLFPAKDGDCPDGCTINPIILENSNE